MNADQLAENFERIFERLLIPEDKIKAVHSFGLCEDGVTLQVLLDLADGRTLVITASPGSPLAVNLEGGN